MTYVFDSNTLITLFTHFYPSRFPTLWQKFEESVKSQRIITAREVLREVGAHDGPLADWAKSHRDFFHVSSPEELVIVAQIFRVPHFHSLVRKQERLQGKPVADPFLIAKAKVLQGCVVTEEANKPNASKIPNVCEHFKIECLCLEGFMERENWTF